MRNIAATAYIGKFASLLTFIYHPKIRMLNPNRRSRYGQYSHFDIPVHDRLNELKPTDATHNFFIAMSLYPEVQRKAQAELDRVIGTDRLPDFSDYADLVYIQATILETMRWIPVTPIIFPHRVTVDDHYRGFHIPKGTMVLAVSFKSLVSSKQFC